MVSFYMRFKLEMPKLLNAHNITTVKEHNQSCDSAGHVRREKCPFNNARDFSLTMQNLISCES